MYIIEASRPPEEDYEVAYHLVAEKEDELTIFKRNIGSIALEAVGQKRITHDEAFDFLSKLYEGSLGTHVNLSSKATLHSLTTESEELANDRMHRLFENAATNDTANGSMWDEFEALRELIYHGSYSSGELISWVNNLGQICIVSEGRLEPYTSTDFEDAFGNNAPQTQTARKLGLTAFVSQLEVVWPHPLKPKVRSPLEHTTLGSLNQGGGFDPFVTVLSTS